MLIRSDCFSAVTWTGSTLYRYFKLWFKNHQTSSKFIQLNSNMVVGEISSKARRTNDLVQSVCTCYLLKLNLKLVMTLLSCLFISSCSVYMKSLLLSCPWSVCWHVICCSNVGGQGRLIFTSCITLTLASVIIFEITRRHACCFC